MTLMHSDPTGDRVVLLEEMDLSAPIDMDEEDAAPSATDTKAARKATARKQWTAEQRARRKVASARTASRSGLAMRPSCNEIAKKAGRSIGCGHKKHSEPSGRRK